MRRELSSVERFHVPLAFAPLVAFLLGISAITVPWATLLISALIGASNFFELLVVRIVNNSKAWYERA